MYLRISAFILSFAFLFSPFQLCAEEDEEAWKRVGFWIPGIPDSEIESTLFTHLLLGYLNINSSSFEIISQPLLFNLDKYFDSFSSTVKQKNPSVKTILCIWGDADFSLMMSNASSRQIFIQSSFNIATTYGFDGIDFYWYNNHPHVIITQSDMNNMGTFLQEWRQAANDTHQQLILTATVPFSPNYTSSIMYPVKSMQANLNWVHVKTFAYTYPSNISKFIAASSPLYDPSNKLISTDYFIQQWLDSGLSASKLVMGLPLFGYSWNLTDPKDPWIGAPTTGMGESPHDYGWMTYKEINAGIQLYGGYSQYNATYAVNYWSQGSTLITFDDVEAIRQKVSYAMKNKLLGYFLWQVSNDDNWKLSLTAKGKDRPKGDGDRPRKKDKLKIILILVAVSVLLCGLIFFKLKGTIKAAKKSSSKTDMETAKKTYDIIPDLQIFSLSNIEEATDNFSIENKIGGGGFGLVYKGILSNGEKIAVKKRSKGSKQGLKEFKNEITLAARLQHVNLIQLLGFCTDKEQMLVYEYMPNKSLDFYLFDPEKQHLLDWRQRVCIIEGVTQGLLYLQEYSRLTIIHRDLKASNILLDHEMKPKIADFGMAKPFKKDAHESTNGFVGTYGYIPPEYVKKGLCTIQSDVYSFGILLLQIISSKRISGLYGENNDLSLLEYAYKLWKEGKGMEFVDASLDDTSSHCKLMTCLQVALLCVQNNAEDRPCMLQVSSMLLRFEGNNIATPKQPAYSKLENEGGTAIIFVQNSEICSQNETTMSPVLGR